MNNPSNHPKYREMLESGVTDQDHVKRSFQVYLDLCEVHQWWNVRVHPCNMYDVIFISGHPARGLAREFVLALDSGQSLSPLDVQKYIRQIREYSKTEVEGLNIAVIDTDSSVTFYKMSAGLLPPLPLVAENKYRKRHNPARRRQFAYPKLPGSTDSEDKNIKPGLDSETENT